MTTLRLADVVSSTEPAGVYEPVQRTGVDSPAPSRRGFLRGLWAVGVGVGLAAVGALPPARRALAVNGDRIYRWATSGPCVTYALDHDCDPICGPSWSSIEFCARHGGHPGLHKRNRFGYYWRPDRCWPPGSGRTTDFDGWHWRCGDVVYRCHDGIYCGRSCVNTICRIRR